MRPPHASHGAPLPEPRDHLAGETCRQVATVDLPHDHIGTARAVHGPTLRRLPTNEHIVGSAAELTLPLRDEELVAHNQTPTRFSRVLLRHAHLPGEAPSIARRASPQ